MNALGGTTVLTGGAVAIFGTLTANVPLVVADGVVALIGGGIQIYSAFVPSETKQ